MLWLAIKNVHVVTVLVSVTLFVLRGVWMLRDSPRRYARWARVVPHVNDSMLLFSGVGLAVLSQQYPLREEWLTAKLVGLLLYIALGLVALRWGKTKRVRATAWVAALAVFVYIVAVAVTRSPTL